MKPLIHPFRRATAWCLLFAAVLFSPTSLWAQTFSIVGTGTTSNGSSSYPAPFGNFYYGARHQFFITAAQLSAAGIPAGVSIQSLGFNVTALNSTATHNGFYIKVWTTTLANPISISYHTGPATAETTPANHTPVVGWNQFTFITPFTWNGTDNLVVETCFNNTSWTNNASTEWTTTLTGATYSRYYRADASGVCASTLTTATSTTTRPNMRIGWSSATPCAGPLTPGATVSSANPVCSGASFTLSMSSPPTGAGLTYQWQSSPDGSMWSDIPGATNSTHTTSQTSATWYQCVVTCTADMSTATSTPLQVNMAGFLSCYCIPIYTSGTGFGDYLSLVQLGSIDNPTGASPSPYYVYYPPSPTTTTTLEQGCTYTLVARPGTYTSNDIAAWIDYNQDGILSPSEKIGEIYNMPASPATASFTFTVPVTATLGVTRLRVREADQSSTSLDPCVTYTWGETEDYDITIAAPTAVWYADADGDGYGDPANSVTACTAPSGYVANNTDCDDTNSSVNPGASEVCNGIDDDCDGLIDDADPSVSGQPTWYADNDGDSYGDASSSVMACSAPSGYVADNTDCDDSNSSVNPGMAEVCSNGIDDNCDGNVDENDLSVSVTPAGPVTKCANVSVTLNSTVTGMGTITYQWYKGLTAVSGATDPSHTTTKKGTHYVVVTNGICTAISNLVSISNTPSPPASITNLSGTTDLCVAGGSISLKGNGTAYTYAWKKDGSYTGATSKFVTVSSPGDYSVEVTNIHGCTTESAVLTITTSCRLSDVAQGSLQLYPNPTDGSQVVLSADLNSDAPVTITISTLLGQEVLRLNTQSDGGLLQQTIDLPATLASGTYLLQLNDGSTVRTQQLVIQR